MASVSRRRAVALCGALLFAIAAPKAGASPSLGAIELAGTSNIAGWTAAGMTVVLPRPITTTVDGLGEDPDFVVAGGGRFAGVALLPGIDHPAITLGGAARQLLLSTRLRL